MEIWFQIKYRGYILETGVPNKRGIMEIRFLIKYRGYILETGVPNKQGITNLKKDSK